MHRRKRRKPKYQEGTPPVGGTGAVNAGTLNRWGVMKRIILHWSAGTYKPNAHEKACYHYLIDDKGKCHTGKYAPEDNLDCRDGLYAAHTGGQNTGSIGVCMCGMHGYRSPIEVGDFPLTKIQAESTFKICALLCRKYEIPIDKDHVKTHREVGLELPRSSSAGKIDITYLPFEPNLYPDEIGEYIRNKVRWYYKRLGY